MTWWREPEDQEHECGCGKHEEKHEKKCCRVPWEWLMDDCWCNMPKHERREKKCHCEHEKCHDDEDKCRKEHRCPKHECPKHECYYCWWCCCR